MSLNNTTKNVDNKATKKDKIESMNTKLIQNKAEKCEKRG